MRKNNNYIVFDGGISFAGLLFIVFLILKLTHTIDWSWAWIFSPLWIPVAAAVLYVIVLSVYAVIIAIFTGLDR